MQFETGFYANTSRPSVLVIEAEQVVRSALYYILRDRCRTQTFATPEDTFASVTEAPDVVLIGIAILQNSDETLLARFCEQFAGAKFLIIAERNSDTFPESSLGHAIHGIIGKPISVDLVQNAVDGALLSPVPPGEPARLIRSTFA